MARELVKVNIRLSAEKLEKLKAKAAKIGCSYNFLVRRAIDAYLADKRSEKADE